MQVLEVQMHSFKCVLTIFLVMQPLPAIYFGHIDDELLEKLINLSLFQWQNLCYKINDCNLHLSKACAT